MLYFTRNQKQQTKINYYCSDICADVTQLEGTMAKELDHGFVYLITNGDFERLGSYKIGKTVSVEQRLANFNSSTESLPDWRAIAYIETDQQSLLESTLHLIFKEHRRSSRRELFDFAEDRDDGFCLDEVLDIFERQAELIGGTFTLAETPTEKETTVRTCNQPKNKFSFKALVGLRDGDELIWDVGDGVHSQKFYVSSVHKMGNTYLVTDPNDVNSTDPAVYRSLSSMGLWLSNAFPGLDREQYWDRSNWYFGGKSFKDYFDEYLQNLT